MKAVLAAHEVSAPPQSLESALAERKSGFAGKTLGSLVNSLLESFLVEGGGATLSDPLPTSCGSTSLVGFRIQIALPDMKLNATADSLRELVAIRNNLVHHFVTEHDLATLDGCRAAQDALTATSRLIETHIEDLRAWTKDTNRVRPYVAEQLKSGPLHDLLVSDYPPLNISAIESALFEAAANLAVENWTPVSDASAWISERYPQEHPSSYGCRRWRQVIHNSKHFDSRYFVSEGRREARYRVKPKP